MRSRAVLAIGALVVMAVLIALWLGGGRGNDQMPSPHPQATASNGSSHADHGPASASDAGTARRMARTTGDRAALLEAIATARSHRVATPTAAGSTRGGGETAATGTTLDILDRTGDSSAWQKRTLGTLNSLLGECYDLGRAEDPNLDGNLVLRFTLVGEPKVGGLLERVDIVDENTSITQQTFRDCVTQSLYALELDPPPEGVRVEREISLKFP